MENDFHFNSGRLPGAPDWEKIGQAPWSPRDSMGYTVFHQQLWIFGGWLDSWQPCPRDVWSSADGVNWECRLEHAPWKHSDFPVTLTHADRLWVMGGWYNGRLADASPGHEVWSSPDGKNWVLECAAAGWTPRVGAAAASFAGRMWVFGGVQDYYHGDRSDLKNDIWSSRDGRTWEQVLASAPWAPRAFHQAVVFQNKIWVLGGGNYVPEYEAFHDVWCSDDGVSWTQVTAEAPWSARLWFSALAFRGCLWVLGGWTKEPFRDWADVWYSSDGREWKSLQTPQIWAGRHAQAAFVFRDAIWIAGGHARPLSDEVWRLNLPEGWQA